MLNSILNAALLYLESILHWVQNKHTFVKTFYETCLDLNMSAYKSCS